MDDTSVKISEFRARGTARARLSGTQLELIQAGRLAAMDELGAGIAHTLNQPLAAILALSELIRSAPNRTVGGFSRELELIVDQAERMAKIIDNLCGFSLQSSMELETFDPSTCLDQALILACERFRCSEIEVIRTVDESLPQIRADRAQIQQVILSLLINAFQALEAIPDPDKRLKVALRVDGASVEYSIEDNGPGIGGDVGPRIFEPFFTTKGLDKGLGLGLSLAQGIVARHGGEIRHEPVDGGGARFVVRLRCDSSVHELAPRRAVAQAGKGKGLALRVLVVDDEEVLHIVFRSILLRAGWTTVCVGSGEEALELLETETFAAALVDIKMPGIDGFETCSRMSVRWPQMALITISGFVTDDDQRRLLEECGVHEVLRKPAKPKLLIATVERAYATMQGAVNKSS